jgi:hypothetical protein
MIIAPSITHAREYNWQMMTSRRLSYGERKVYDVTGDYHYAINNNEPYFSFWFDKNKKLVKWFKLK